MIQCTRALLLLSAVATPHSIPFALYPLSLYLRVVGLEHAGQPGLAILLSHFWGFRRGRRGQGKCLHALLLSHQRLVLWILAGL